MSIYKTQGIFMPKLLQCTNSRHVSNNEHTYINRNRKSNTPVRRLTPQHIIQTFPLPSGMPKKPFSRAGPCRIGMVQYCQRAKRFVEPIARYPLYPGMEKSPLSTYVANWRWYAQPKKAPERKITLTPDIRGVGMDGYLQGKNKSGLQELRNLLREKTASRPTEINRDKEVYRG